MHADLVLLNGHIYTLDPRQPRASALAARDGRILYVGDDATARGMQAPDAAVVDLRGRCVIPGLADAHLHFSSFGLSLREVQAETPTLQEALERVAARAAELPEGQWIVGRGWNHNEWGGAFPTAAQLDAVAPRHPVYLRTKSGHAGWANSLALGLAGVTANTPDPAGGQILRDDAGRPAGVLLEDTAMLLVERCIPEPSAEALVEALRAAAAEATRRGLTCVHDMDGPAALRAEQTLHARGELGLRVLKSIPFEQVEEALALGVQTGLGDDMLRIGQVKMFADGALGPRTALMLAPFETAPLSTGIRTTPLEALRSAVLRANAAGLGCAIHAIGDRACREVLDLYEESANARRGAPDRRVRNRVEHLQILHPADVRRLTRLGVIASMQPIHATSDMYISDTHLGPRAAGAYVFRSLLDAGTVLAFGSDCPVEVIDPLLGLHAAITRRRTDGTPGPEGWRGAQRLSVEEAVRGFTWGAAYAAGMEDRLGSLEAGKLADATILEQDVFQIDPMEIPQAGVAGTLVGGRFAYRAPEL